MYSQRLCLVFPFVSHNSKFGDIYDEDHFISTLKDYITVVKKLPAELMERYDSNISNIQNLRVQAWAPPRYYLEEVYPVLFKWRYAVFGFCLSN